MAPPPRPRFFACFKVDLWSASVGSQTVRWTSDHCRHQPAPGVSGGPESGISRVILLPPERRPYPHAGTASKRPGDIRLLGLHSESWPDATANPNPLVPAPWRLWRPACVARWQRSWWRMPCGGRWLSPRARCSCLPTAAGDRLRFTRISPLRQWKGHRRSSRDACPGGVASAPVTGDPPHLGGEPVRFGPRIPNSKVLPAVERC